jgi:hypothetical protein
MTDGRVTGSRLGLSDVVARAISNGVIVDVISSGGDTTIPQGQPFAPLSRPYPAVVVRSDVYVKHLAEQSGGILRTNRGPARAPTTVMGGGGFTINLGEFMPLPVSPGPRFAEILNGLRQMYSVGIIPPWADGQMHALQVRVRRPGALVQAPRAYFARKGTS